MVELRVSSGLAVKGRFFPEGRVLTGAYLPTTHLEKMLVSTELWPAWHCLGTELTTIGPWSTQELLHSTVCYTGSS